MSTKLAWSVISLLCTAPLFAQHDQHHQSPYVEQEGSGIAALSRQEAEDLRRGAGMGLARAAELNHYPGPLHVLQLDAELSLSPQQEARVKQIHAEMLEQAKRLGEKILELERHLDRRFARRHIDESALREATAEIASAEGELRFAHLRAHLKTREVLKDAQVERYDQLRGYSPAPADPAALMLPDEEEACSEIAGLEPLLRKGTALVVGELHGSRESPAFVGAVVCQAQARELTVTVALELLDSERPGIETYLASDGSPADRQSLIAGGTWSAEYQDGRSSGAILELLDRLRVLRVAGRPVSVELFDRGGWQSGQERDRLMAEALAGVLETTASDMVIVLTGNIHSRVVRGTKWDATYEPMTYLLAGRSEWNLVSLDVGHAGGSVWICNGNVPSSCGVRPVSGRGKDSGLSIELGSDPALTGHHGRYHVGSLSASLPAAIEHAAIP